MLDETLYKGNHFEGSGLRVNDYILEINGHPIRKKCNAVEILKTVPVSDSFHMKIAKNLKSD